jgi:outer membrane protein, heavy metal efflux system
MSSRKIAGVPLVAAGLAMLGACALRPEGTDQEREKVEKAGAPYEPRIEDRAIPELPERPEWPDVLRRVFLANGELETAYFEWKAALERVDVAGAWPNSDLAVGFEYAFSGGRMKSFDRTTFTLAPDSMRNLTLPVKAQQAAKVALDQARAAGERFRVVKFDLQKRALFGWADYTLRAREIALVRQDLALRRVGAEAARVRSEAGGQQARSVAEVVALRMAESRLADLESDQATQRAMLNALMGRDAHAELIPPEGHPEPRKVPVDDAGLLAAAAEMFPEVAQMAEEVMGRADALELAKLRWIPDINPTFTFTGTVMQAIGLGVTLPTTIAEIRGQIRAAEAELRAGEARFRQGRAARIGEYVGLVASLRRAQERERFFSEQVLPLVRRYADARAAAYEAAAAELSELVEARRMALDVELVIAKSEAEVEKAIVDIECCLGVDIETIPPAEVRHE